MAGSSYADKRVLITGGAGFIGSQLAKKLVALGARVTVVDSLNPDYGGNLFNLSEIRSMIEIAVTDIRDPHALQHLVGGQDYLFNLAAQTSHAGSMSDPRADVEINVNGQINVLEACRRFNREIVIVFASTRQVYGVPSYLPVDEEHPVRPVDVNGVSKFAAEGYHLIYDRCFGVRSTVLRLTNTYGPGMRIKDAKQTFLGIWLRNVLERKPFLVFGDGSQRRDFNFVDDVVEAFLAAGAAEQTRGNVFNIGAPEAPSLKEVADLLVELEPGSRYEMRPFPPERAAIDIGNAHSSFAKFERHVGWRPAVELREGLSRSLDFYKSHIDQYVC